QARAALVRRDGTALTQLAREVQVARQPAAFLSLVARRLPPEVRPTQLDLLRRTQHAYPGDFWANFYLAQALYLGEPPRWDEAARFYTAALALRPRSAAVYGNLGAALVGKRDLDGALAALDQALLLNPASALTHYNLGNARHARGDREGAIAA